ncbi:MAG TPA: hypothetical protein VJ833_11510 [Rhodanobacteraceae bacterium]|nr:hypothetical protein [Rhodanobacteraceae bacterium]
MTTTYDFKADLPDGAPQKLDAYHWKVLLIVAGPTVSSICAS